MADNQDLEAGTTLGKDGNIERIRTEKLKGKEDYELEYLRHLQWQHSMEMSKRYIV